MKVYITKVAYDQIVKEVRRYSNLETGGAVIGYARKNSLFITRVTDAGPRALHHRSSLKLDSRSCFIKYLGYWRENKKLKYLGDWHSHPSNRLKLSRTDLLTFKKKAKTHYNVSTPIMIITSTLTPVTLRAFTHFNKKIISTSPRMR